MCDINSEILKKLEAIERRLDAMAGLPGGITFSARTEQLKSANWIAENVYGRRGKKSILSKAIILRRQAKRGLIPHKRQGRRVLFDPADFRTMQPLKPGDRKSAFFE